jgi:hypothetical protein
MEEFWSAQTAMQESVPAIVTRYRKADVLTWRLLHGIEREVIAEVNSTGRYPKWILDALRAPDYPKDERAVSFEGHDFIPPVFAAIEDAWRRLDQETGRTDR